MPVAGHFDLKKNYIRMFQHMDWSTNDNEKSIFCNNVAEITFSKRSPYVSVFMFLVDIFEWHSISDQ